MNGTHSFRQHVILKQGLKFLSLFDDRGFGRQDVQCLGELAELLLGHSSIILRLDSLLLCSGGVGVLFLLSCRLGLCLLFGLLLGGCLSLSGLLLFLYRRQSPFNRLSQ